MKGSRVEEIYDEVAWVQAAHRSYEHSIIDAFEMGCLCMPTWSVLVLYYPQIQIADGLHIIQTVYIYTGKTNNKG